MDEQTKAKLREAGLEGVVASFEKLSADLATERTTRATEKAALERSIAEKDAVISQKNDDLVNARKSYKKLADMTEVEKEALSEKEKELLERQESLEKQTADFQKAQQEAQQKEVDARRGRAIAKIAGKDADLQKKVEDSFKRILDHDKATTEEEIAAIATQAFNMLGVPKPDPVNTAINMGGDGEAGIPVDGQNYADTQAGKGLMETLGLNLTGPQNLPPTPPGPQV